MKHPKIFTLKKSMTACFAAIALLSFSAAPSAGEKLEKPNLKLGFIKLTDMAPLAIAYEKGFFKDEGLNVQLEAQANWKLVLDRVVSGELDGSHMLAPMPFGASIGFGTKADIVTAYTMGVNGNAITVSNDTWSKMKAGGAGAHPISAESLKPVAEAYKNEGKAFNMGMTFPVGSHNFKLRYWLAGGGINPGYYAPPQDVSGQIGSIVMLSVTPPPQMPATMEAGTILGYCVGEPWNQQAVVKGVGVPVITDDEMWKDIPEKILGVSKEWAEKNPKTHVAVVKALIRASMWLDEDNGKNRAEAVKILAQSKYVGADEAVIANSMTGTFEYEKGDKRKLPDFNVFFRNNATYPYYSGAVWYLTQMRRWGQINEFKDDAWYMETAKKILKPDVYMAAADALISDNKAKAADFPAKTETGFKAPQSYFIDKVAFDGTKPNDYLSKFAIGLKGKQNVEDGRVTGD
jgi:nitrate/nitrite transport system substrate-binding protein